MNKKLLLSIGIISIIPTSISTIISCAGNHDKKILPQKESLPKQVAQDVAVAKNFEATSPRLAGSQAKNSSSEKEKAATTRLEKEKKQQEAERRDLNELWYVKREIKDIFSGVISTINDGIAAVSAPKIFDAQALEKLGIEEALPMIPNGIKLKYTHGALAKNGYLTVTLYLSKGDKSYTTKFSIIFVDINPAKNAFSRSEEIAKIFMKIFRTPIKKLSRPSRRSPSRLQDTKDIAIAKKAIEAIAGVSSKVNTAIVEVKRDALDKKALKRLGIDGNFPTIPNGITLKYSHGPLTKNGFLIVEVFLQKMSPFKWIFEDAYPTPSTDSALFYIKVTDINVEKQ